MSINSEIFADILSSFIKKESGIKISGKKGVINYLLVANGDCYLIEGEKSGACEAEFLPQKFFFSSPVLEKKHFAEIIIRLLNSAEIPDDFENLYQKIAFLVRVLVGDEALSKLSKLDDLRTIDIIELQNVLKKIEVFRNKPQDTTKGKVQTFPFCLTKN